VTLTSGTHREPVPARANLPPGWAWTQIDDVLEPQEDGQTLHQGWSPRCEKAPSQTEEDWGVLKTTAIQPGLFLPEHNKLLPKGLRPRPRIEVRSGDILVTCAGPRARCGIACLVKRTRRRLMMSGKMYRFRVPSQNMESRFVESYLQTMAARDAIDKMKTGGSDSGLNLTHDRFRLLEIPLAPTPEQRRIVAKIEELFSQLDAAVEELKKAKAQLKRYRQSVLKAAFEGKLTEEWRKRRATSHEPLETAQELLARIREERKRVLGSKYKDPPPLDTSELPGLPKGWAWARLDCLADSMLGKMLDKAKHTTGSLLPYLRNVNVRWGYVDTGDLAKMYFKAGETERYSVNAGDVLVCEGGEPGRAAVWDGRVENMRFQKALHRVRPTAGILPKWLVLHLQNDAGQGLLERYFTGSTIKHLTGEGLSRYAVRVTATAEQQEIVAAVEERLSVADAEEKAIEAALKQAVRLRQSILKRAFEGRLVPQDPSDEPATELLRRIREQRLATGQERLVRRQKRLATSEERRSGKRRATSEKRLGRKGNATSD
jgi:type I restriction enzyme, S subunit